MAHRTKTSRPVMRPTTRFHEDEGGRLAGDQGQQLPPRHGGVRFERAGGRHHTDLKHVFSEVDTLTVSHLLTLVASRNLLLYQSPPTYMPSREAKVRRRKDDTRVGTTARGNVERLSRVP